MHYVQDGVQHYIQNGRQSGNFSNKCAIIDIKLHVSIIFKHKKRLEPFADHYLQQSSLHRDVNMPIHTR